MSWLNNITDLAGKAESLLNNIDQSAAVAISKASTPKKQDSEYDINISDAKVNTNVDDSLLLQDKQQDTHLSNSKPSQTKVEVLKPELQKLNQSSKQTDEALFKFLNSTQKTGKIKNKSNSRPNKLLNEEIKIKTKPKDIAGLEVSRNSSYDSLVSKKSSRKISDNGSVSDHPESNSEAEASGFPADSTASESEFEMIASLASKDSDRDSPGSCNQTSGSDLVVENKLLKTELTSLHHELTQVAERNKKMKEELQRKNKDLLGRCEDLDEELKVKKTQFSALNIKFLEVEKLFELEQTRTAQLKANNERF